MDGWINEWLEANFLSVRWKKTSWASLLGQRWSVSGITVIMEQMKFRVSRFSDPAIHMKERNQPLPESKFRWGQSWGEWMTWKDDAQWEERLLGIKAGWQRLQTAAPCPSPGCSLPAFPPLQLDLSQDGWCELLPVMYSEPLLSNITVCSKRLYLAFSESPTFFHPRPLLISVALCVLVARINPPRVRGNRSWAPSFTAYKLKGGWQNWLLCLAACSFDTQCHSFIGGIVGAGCLVSFWTPWKTVFTSYGNTFTACLFLWDTLPQTHWLLVRDSVLSRLGI